MTIVTVNPDDFGDTLYQGVEPLATVDHLHAYALQKFSRALGRMFSEQEFYVRDQGDAPGWSAALDLDRCPYNALVWLAQFAGVRLTVGLSDAAARQYVRDRSYTRRGTVPTIIAAAQTHLSGSKRVRLLERDTSPYHFTVLVVTADAPASDVAGTTFIVRDDIIAVKPAGLQFTVQFVSGYVWNEATKTWNAATITWDQATTTAT